MKVKHKIRKIELDFARELDSIKQERMGKKLDLRAISDARLTRAIRMNPKWASIKSDIVNAPRNPGLNGRKKR